MIVNDFIKVSTNMVSAVNADGCLLVFALGGDGQILHNFQTNPQSKNWSGWQGFGMSARKLAITRNCQNRCALFCIDTNGAVNYREQVAPGGSWGPWRSLGGGIKEFVASSNNDGRFEVFAIGSDKALYHIWERELYQGGPWDNWTKFGDDFSKLSVARNRDGRIEVFAIRGNLNIAHVWQTRPGGPWSSLQSLGGNNLELATAINEDGRLAVFAIGADGRLYHASQDRTPASEAEQGGPWSALVRLDDRKIKKVAAERNADGRLEAFAIGADDNALYHMGQTVKGGNTWCPFNSLGGTISDLVATSTSDCTLAVFAAGQDQTVWHIQQSQQLAGGWASWSRLPAFAPGTVILYKEASFESPSWTITLNEPPNERHRVIDWMFDQATYVAFNLPTGVVMTLMADAVQDPQNVADLAGCGQCTDLIGTGNPQWIDLRLVKMSDCVSMYFWRHVNVSMGYVQLYEDYNFAGNCATIFLSEWPRGKFMSLSGWYMQDRTSSIRWTNLDERQYVALAVANDGSGLRYSKIAGWAGDRQLADLRTVGLDDMVSSLRWDDRVPMKEFIEPFELKIPHDADVASFGSSIQGKNQSDVAQQVTLTLSESMEDSYTVTTTDSHVTGVKTTLTQKLGGGGEANVGFGTETTWSIEMSYSYTRTDEVSRSYTKTRSVSVAPTLAVQKQCTWVAWCNVKLGALPPTTYQTRATRWYDVPMGGAVLDPLNNNWYRREETISVTVEGNLQLVMDVGVVTKPL